MEGTDSSVLGTVTFALFAAGIGVLAGLGAVVFRYLIIFFNNLLFFGKISFESGVTAQTSQSPWGPFVILVPVAGALGVAFIAKYFTPQVIRSGIPDIMNAVYYPDGTLDKGLAFFRTVAASISIGSGAPVGREGPIFQVGAALASTLGRYLSLPREQVRILMAAGGAGGIAATFNTPVGGILFSMELVLPDASIRDLIPLVVASGAATYVRHIFLGNQPYLFLATTAIPASVESPFTLLLHALLGAMLGITSAFFIKAVYTAADFFDNRLTSHYYISHSIGMLVVGILIYATTVFFGQYYTIGGGLGTVEDILHGTISAVSILLAFFLLQLLAASLALGSGASGGVLFPTLLIGAAFGEAFGIVLQALFPNLHLNPQAFAISGMAGVFGSTTGAVFAAIVMIFEMTLDFYSLIPITVAVLIAYGVRRLVLKDSMYTLKLALEGRPVPEALDIDRPKSAGKDEE
jgi:CIC family chloride channel protein